MMATIPYALKRHFSSFSRVVGSTIQLSNQQPPKLRIPVSPQLQYDFSLPEGETVAQFEKKVSQEQGVRSFRILSETKNREATLEEVTRSKFSIEVNKHKYEVYPTFEQMVAH